MEFSFTRFSRQVSQVAACTFVVCLLRLSVTRDICSIEGHVLRYRQSSQWPSQDTEANFNVFKSHIRGLREVDFDPYYLFLFFKSSLVVVVFMIYGRQKHYRQQGFELRVLLKGSEIYLMKEVIVNLVAQLCWSFPLGSLSVQVQADSFLTLAGVSLPYTRVQL